MTDQLRDRIAAAVNHGLWFADADPDSVLPETVNAVLAVVQPELDQLRAERDELLTELDGRDEEARERWVANQEKQLGIRYADFRDGKWEMDLAMGREMAAAYVAMAKTMLGDAPNYSETRLEFDVKIAESPEIYTLVVQRHALGALTPHEARQRAEAERDEALADAEQLRAQLAGLWPCTCGHLPGQHRYDAAIGRNYCRSCPADADLHEYAATDTATEHDADELVRCSGLHCPNGERFTKAAERGWLHGHLDTWQCPKCRAAADSAPTTTP